MKKVGQKLVHAHSLLVVPKPTESLKAASKQKEYIIEWSSYSNAEEIKGIWFSL